MARKQKQREKNQQQNNNIKCIISIITNSYKWTKVWPYPLCMAAADGYAIHNPAMLCVCGCVDTVEIRGHWRAGYTDNRDEPKEGG